MAARSLYDEDIDFGTDTQQSYWQAFNLDRDPFQTTEDAEFDAVSQWDDHLDLLMHLVKFSNVLLSIVGESDSGKSSLIKYLAAKTSLEFPTYQLDGHAQLDPLELLLMMARKLSIPLTDDLDANLSETMEAFLNAVTHSQQPSVIILSKGHLLPQKSLELLFDLIAAQPDDAALLNIVIAGEPVLEKMLETSCSEEVKENYLHIFKLNPFTLEETRNYITYCLTSAGLQENFPFSNREIQQIHKISDGYIGRIKQVAKQMLIAKLGRSQGDQSFLTQNRLVVVSSAMVLVAALVYGVGVYTDTDTDDTRFVVAQIPATSEQSVKPIAVLAQANIEQAPKPFVEDELPPVSDAREIISATEQAKQAEQKPVLPVAKPDAHLTKELETQLHKPAATVKAEQHKAPAKKIAPHQPTVKAATPVTSTPKSVAQEKQVTKQHHQVTQPKKPHHVTAEPKSAPKTVIKQAPKKAAIVVHQPAKPVVIKQSKVVKPTPVTKTEPKPVVSTSEKAIVKQQPTVAATKVIKKKPVDLRPHQTISARQQPTRPKNYFVDDDLQGLANSIDPDQLDSYRDMDAMDKKNSYHEGNHRSEAPRQTVAKVAQKAPVEKVIVKPTPEVASRSLRAIKPEPTANAIVISNVSAGKTVAKPTPSHRQKVLARKLSRSTIVLPEPQLIAQKQQKITHSSIQPGMELNAHSKATPQQLAESTPSFHEKDVKRVPKAKPHVQKVVKQAVTPAVKHPYVIQVVASGSKPRIEGIIKANNLQSTSSIRKIKRAGLPFYALEYGQFATRAEAEKALKSLNVALRKYQPIVRRT